MKSKLFNILIVLMFFVGLFVLLYPAISDYVNRKHASRIIASYTNAVRDMSAEKINEMFEEADDYNKRLASTQNAFFDPKLVSGYDDVLDIIGIGVMGYIYIDRIKVELPIYHGTSEGVLQIGVGHIEGTSLPVGGKNTHCVLSGHRGLPSAKLFTNLDKLDVGDVFRITVLDRVFTYEVDQIKTVLPSETQDLRQVVGKDYCTLMTCTPYGINTHRLLVRGVRVANAEDKPGIYIANEAFSIDIFIIAPIFSAPLLLVLLILLLVRGKYKKRRRKLEMAVEALSELDKKEAEEKGDNDSGSDNDSGAAADNSGLPENDDGGMSEAELEVENLLNELGDTEKEENEAVHEDNENITKEDDSNEKN